MRKLGKRFLAGILAGVLLISGSMNTLAASTSAEVSEREISHMALSRQAAAQGMVLLENRNQTLPIAIAGKIALWGGGACNTVKGGTGSGDVNQRQTVSVYQGLQNAGYQITTEEWLKDYTEENGSQIGKDTILTEEDLRAGAEGGTDTAIYVISRSSGEFQDRPRSDFELTETEQMNIQRMAEYFEHSIVLLNVGGMMDTSFIREIPELDSVLLMSQAGMEGGNAVVDVLNGTITPSGKLTDTWALQYEDYPASETFAGNDGDSLQEDYEEGIYVGYRYFDTFGLDVAYEFGYGKSYTEFTIEVNEVRADKKKVEVDVTVTNTGDTFSGKEVVQVYFTAPEGKLEKPYQELAAYAKTDELAPGGAQKLTVSFATTEMSSYNEKRASYMLEAGDYILRVGNSSRNTQVAAVLQMEQSVVTEIVGNELAADKELEELSNAGATPITYPGEQQEIRRAKVIQLPYAALRYLDGYNQSIYDDETVTTYVPKGTDTSTLPVSGRADEYKQQIKEVTVVPGAKLIDVYNGNLSIEQFVAGLTYEELGNLTNGASSASVSGPVVGAQANSVQGAAGETTGLYYDSYGIPNIVLADGPAGLRLTQEYTQNDTKYYQYCTAWPIGTLLAQTWDTELVETVAQAIGKEMEEYGVTLWLAPGMNIHRDPLCGRNFEYYSEDPLIAGTMGAAATKGVQSIPGIGVTVKHFAANNQETNRNSENNTISERALREIYLKGFEITVKSAQPMAIMTSYNKINGEWAAGSYDLCTNLARGEWGFEGLIMTDWGAAAPVSESMHAGNDLIMPGNNGSAVAGTLQRVYPEFGEDGYVTVTRSWWSQKENWNDLVLQADGDVTLNTQVEAGVALNEKVAEKVAEGTAQVTVQGSGEVLADLSDTSKARTVSYTGYYDDSGKLYLGDVQKSVIHILEIIMQTTQFQKLNSQVKLTSYTNKFAGTLKEYSSYRKGDAVGGIVRYDLERWIAFVEELERDGYTQESWDALQDALENARVALEQATTQEEINAARDALMEAFLNLEYGVQKQHLQTAVEAAEAILNHSGDYEPEGIEILKEVLEEAKTVLEDKKATQSVVDNAAKALLDAIERLTATDEIWLLQSLLDASKVIDPAKYTLTSAAAFEEAVAHGKEVLADTNREEGAVEEAYARLVKAIKELQLKGNKAALESVIVKAGEILDKGADYVASSIAGLEKALSDAQEIYDKRDASQEEINEATVSLTQALVKVRLKGDVNQNGRVDTGDTVELLRYQAEYQKLSLEQLEGADVNGDGVADTKDAVLILQYASEKIATFR